MWSPLWYWAESRHVEISSKSCAKQPESTPNSIIWKLLPFPNMARKDRYVKTGPFTAYLWCVCDKSGLFPRINIPNVTAW